jgi:hypothetical protein
MLTVADAENAWFIRVDGVTGYGDDPFLEKITINPEVPLLFLNIDRGGRHGAYLESQGGRTREEVPESQGCSARRIVPGVINMPVTVDVRNFGVRMPP